MRKPKTHELWLTKASSDLETVELSCLNPLATEFRYPEEEPDRPSKALMEASIERAETVLSFVKKKIKL